MLCPTCGRETPAGEFCSTCGAYLGPGSAANPVGSATPPESKSPAASAPTAAVPSSYGGFWMRFLAAIIDGFILQVAMLVVVIPVVFVIGLALGPTGPYLEESGIGEVIFAALMLCIFAMHWIYEAGFLCSARQATPGKSALGMIVTSQNGARLTFARASGRHFGKYLSSLVLIGYLIQPFTPRRQALHDLIAGTLVVRKG